MNEIKSIVDKLIAFRNERNWKQFHNPKDLALALSIEAAELNELFLWKDKDEIDNVRIEKIGEELADIFAYAFMLVHHYEFDLEDIITNKMKKNAEKYPVEKSKNLSKKYTEL